MTHQAAELHCPGSWLLGLNLGVIGVMARNLFLTTAGGWERALRGGLPGFNAGSIIQEL